MTHTNFDPTEPYKSTGAAMKSMAAPVSVKGIRPYAIPRPEFRISSARSTAVRLPLPSGSPAAQFRR